MPWATANAASPADQSSGLCMEKEYNVVRPSSHLRGEYPVVVSLAVSLILILISLVGWWFRS